MTFISDPQIWADRILTDPRWLAESMQRLGRFGGQHPTSNVLNHSLEVAYMCRHLSPSGQLWALLHDAHEVLTGEVTRPYKTNAMEAHQEHLDAVLRGALWFTVQMDEYKHVRKLDKLCGDMEHKHWQDYVWQWQSWWTDHDNAVDVFVERFLELTHDRA